jgi:hypothetical protein
MDKEDRVIIKIIGDYLLAGELDKLEKILRKIKLEGKFKKVKKNIQFILDYLYQKKNIQIGDLEIAISDHNNLIKEKIEQRGFLIKKVKTNPDLILGGVFRTKTMEFNFSLINILKKLF